MEWTAEQKKIIGYGAGNLLVSASAGSGKTTVMLGRVLRLIEEGYSLKKMLVSTFTVSAADDMRAKLAERLREKTAETGDRRYADELEYLPYADICTLHKWCQKLIRKYFYVTGDDPAFELAEENECSVMRAEAVTRALEEAAEDPGFEAVCRPYIRRRSNAPLKRMILGILSFADAQPSAEEWLSHAADAYSDGESCREFLASVAAEKFASIAEEADRLEEAAKRLGLDKAARLIDELRAKAAGADIKYTVARGISAIKPEFDELKKRVEKYTCFLDEVNSARDVEAARDARLFLSVARRAGELYAEAKAEKGKLDFADLERRARIILSSPEGEEVRASLTHVFIDEYQDINPLQESIINLAGKDNLFFVGDIKQSIYAFRNCTPSAFAAKREELSAGGGTVELNKNYRSEAGILRFANALFSRIMTSRFGGVDYAETACFVTEKSDGDDKSVEIIMTEKPCAVKEKTDFSEVYSVRDHIASEKRGKREAEADAVTEKIVELLETRSCDEIAVLVRSRGALSDMIARNLRQIGVPVSLSSKLGVSDGRINSLLLSYLRLLDNFRDDVSLAAVMRSRIGGFSDARLASIRASHPECAYFYECVLKEESDPDIAAFLADVRGYTELAGYMTVGGLAGRITSDKKLFFTAMSENLGISKADGLGRLLAQMNSYGGTLSEYLEYLSANEPYVDVPPQPGSVRIMTVHASKGLEFPVVLMCGLGSQFRSDADGGVIADGDFGLGLSSRVAETGETIPSLPLLAARERKKRAELEEEMRVLYVALTRARDKSVLFLPDADYKPKNPDECGCYADWIYPSAVAHGFVRGVKHIDADFAPSVPATVNERTLEKMREYLTAPFAGKAREIKKSVTGLLTEIDDDGEKYSPPALIVDGEYDGQGDRETAMARGTAFHACLEAFDYSMPFDAQSERLSEIENIGLVDKNKLAAAFDAIGEETRGAEIYREQPFLFFADNIEGADDGVLLQGVIDLLAVRGNEAEIIDYKTGFVTDDRREKYERQLNVYAAAVEKVLGLKVTKKKIYLIDGMKFMR